MCLCRPLREQPSTEALLCAVGGSHRANQVECMFRAIDTDQDGSVSPEELATLVHTSMRQHGWTREESEHRANDILTKCARRAHRGAAVAHPTRSRQRTLKGKAPRQLN